MTVDPHDAVEVIDHGAGCPILLICEHASPHVPPGWGKLGLQDDDLARHIGWDIGAADIARRLADDLGASAVLARYSRLFIDCNRDPDRDDSIPAISDGIAVPGNMGLTPEERQRRRALAFTPLHDRIGAMIERHLASGVTPTIVPIHSFTPEMQGVRRPWHMGVLWNECDALGASLMQALQDLGDMAGLEIGANQPYSAREFVTYTMEQHGRKRGLANVALEIRNDLAGDPALQPRLAAHIARALRRAILPAA
ncbi:N-formylglutamate amidohydrolase [Sphingobium amiense]|nr:N-formylglutamate amidohydrolase [Sphingobium amiense]